MNSNALVKIVEQYSRKSEAGYGVLRVMRLSDHKTVFFEPIDGAGRAVMMNKYEVDGTAY